MENEKYLNIRKTGPIENAIIPEERIINWDSRGVNNVNVYVSENGGKSWLKSTGGTDDKITQKNENWIKFRFAIGGRILIKISDSEEPEKVFDIIIFDVSYF